MTFGEKGEKQAHVYCSYASLTKIGELCLLMAKFGLKK
jgi:hypothetical protein